MLDAETRASLERMRDKLTTTYWGMAKDIHQLAQALLQLDQQMTEHRHRHEKGWTYPAETPQSTDTPPTTASPTTDSPSAAPAMAAIRALMKASSRWVQVGTPNGPAELCFQFADRQAAYEAHDKIAALVAAATFSTSPSQDTPPSAGSEPAASPSESLGDSVGPEGRFVDVNPNPLTDATGGVGDVPEQRDRIIHVDTSKLTPIPGSNASPTGGLSTGEPPEWTLDEHCGCLRSPDGEAHLGSLEAVAAYLNDLQRAAVEAEEEQG